MPRPELTYPKGPANTVTRYAHQAQYDLKTVHSIINSSPIAHVSFNPPSPSPTNPSYPSTLPLICRTGNFSSPSSEIQYLYLHTSSASRIYRLCSPNPLPVCVSATIVDGLVLSLSPFSHSMNYRSVTIYGLAEQVVDREEKLYAMELITNGVCPGRWDAEKVRLPVTEAEMTSTGVMRVKIETAAAKMRVGPPGEERRDLEDEEVRKRVWTGVVPCSTVWGEPITSGGGKVEEVPAYLKDVLEMWNKDGLEEARERAVRVQKAKKAGE